MIDLLLVFEAQQMIMNNNPEGCNQYKHCESGGGEQPPAQEGIKHELTDDNKVLVGGKHVGTIIVKRTGGLMPKTSYGFKHKDGKQQSNLMSKDGAVRKLLKYHESKSGNKPSE